MLPSVMGTRPTPDQQQARWQQIQRVWNHCAEEEKRVLTADHRALLEEFKDSLTFGPLPLSPDTRSWSDERMAHNYRELVKVLRNAGSQDDKLRLLAMWLRQEGILQPREFLPNKLRKEIVKSTLKALGYRLPNIRPSELKWALMAEAWMRYFDLMQVEHRRALEGQRLSNRQHEWDVLIAMGFDETAVNAALGHSGGLSTLREAACRFAAERLTARGPEVGEDSVLVAFTKMYPSPQRRARRREREAAKRAASKKPPSS
jgi:hypothetical protein